MAAVGAQVFIAILAAVVHVRALGCSVVLEADLFFVRFADLNRAFERIVCYVLQRVVLVIA